MRFLIAGAGAIGAYIGARMAQAGFDVTLFARGPHLRAMQDRGVQVKSADGDFVARPGNRRFPRRSRAGRRRLPRRKSARPAETCASVETSPGAADYGRQHSEWNSMVVLRGFRRRMEGFASGARGSRGRDFFGHRSASGGWVHRIFFNRDYSSRSDSTHRGQPHFSRRAGRLSLRTLSRNCRGACRLWLARPYHRTYSSRDLGKGSGQRFLQSGQRADSRHTGADGP